MESRLRTCCQPEAYDGNGDGIAPLKQDSLFDGRFHVDKNIKAMYEDWGNETIALVVCEIGSLLSRPNSGSPTSRIPWATPTTTTRRLVASGG